ncbi:MAG TPA: acetate kinase [Candidatus Paceibacterota bacterium]|nr:acetate kinase [Candidatus Paceibacterota bacterium]
MEKNILTINPGSSSKKYALFAGDACLFTAHFEKTESGFAVAYDSKSPVPISEEIYNGSLSQAIARAREKHNAEINAVGIRLVAIGKQFSRHAVIDAQYLALLSKEAERDPAHTPMVISELTELAGLLPGIPVVAASDSAFHSTMPAIARRYAIPASIADAEGIEHAGFHGLSFASAVLQLEKLLGKVPERVISCHMGNGVSITALLNGRSIETSMGYSPLSGVPMSTRSGDIDPEAVLRLTEGSDAKSVRDMLYSQSGLLALSGKSGDMRVLLEAEKNGDENSKMAIDAFAYRIKLLIGAYAAALGGLDALVFSGTMGVRSAPVRNRITQGLSHLDIVIDSGLNEKAASGSDISDTKSPVRVFVLKTDEEQEIAKAVASLI